MPRRRLIAVLLVAVLVLAAFWILRANPAILHGSPLPVGVPADAFEMQVVSVHDGDTLNLQTDSPDGVVVYSAAPVTVRLIGIDTPEIYPQLECYGHEATSELERLAPVGATLLVSHDAGLTDRYDRSLFYLWTEDGTFINLSLVQEGFAVAIKVAPNDAYFDVLKDAENAAQRSNLGMWGSC
ncbi:MAG: thermonuclease family protein [Pseudolysinimonas sp.]|uniref:thermonuclease family protein n=1 Tax=Pseudolysinimonas sp. TaxID=2680009 RepID=UPI0032679A09